MYFIRTHCIYYNNLIKNHIIITAILFSKFIHFVLIQFMFMDKLKSLFKVSSTYQLIVVFVVFGITGSLSLVISEYLTKLFEFSSVILSIFIILIVYQVLLIIIGTMFGEFKYFWEMEKRIISRFKFNKTNQQSNGNFRSIRACTQQ